MNYKKIYDSIIERSKNRILECYSEKHHIIPKCLGGNNSKSNIAILTAKEHYLVHYLLINIYPNEEKLIYAFWMMCNKSRKNRITPSSRAYSYAREKFSTLIKNKPGPNLGIKMSDYTKNKISSSKKGQTSWLGKIHSEETKQKQSKSAKNRNIKDTTEKLRRSSISKTCKNKSKSIEHCKNISIAKQGSKNPMFGKKWKLVNYKRIYY